MHGICCDCDEHNSFKFTSPYICESERDFDRLISTLTKNPVVCCKCKNESNIIINKSTIKVIRLPDKIITINGDFRMIDDIS